jgi:molybdopterin biosynthesis enzyme
MGTQHCPPYQRNTPTRVNDSPPPVPSLQPIAAVLAEMRAACAPVSAQTVAITEAAGLVLAEDLVVDAPVPARTTALRDGYAVAATDLVGVSAYTPLLLSARPPWVRAGDALPPGLDAMVPADAISERGSSVEIMVAPAPGENARRAGEDARSGERLRERGELIRSRDIAAGLAAGLRSAVVNPVLVQGFTDGPAAMLVSLLPALRGTRFRVDPLPQDELLLAGANLILVASYDRAILDLLERIGRVYARGLALRCAETVAVGFIGGTPVVIAPPRLDTLVALDYVLVRPFVSAVARRRHEPAWRQAPVRRKISSAVGLTELVLLHEVDGELEPASAGSLTPSALSHAEGYVIIPPESEGFQAGARVTAYGL